MYAVSLCYNIKINNVYSNKSKMHKRFDTSSYGKEHSLYRIGNKKALDKMKDKRGGRVIS